jgi:hypothetical protein
MIVAYRHEIEESAKVLESLVETVDHADVSRSAIRD